MDPNKNRMEKGEKKERQKTGALTNGSNVNAYEFVINIMESEISLQLAKGEWMMFETRFALSFDFQKRF